MSAATSQPSQAEMGAQLQKAAYTEPPIVPKGLAMSLIIVVLISAIIATIIIALRVLVRGWISRKSKVWGWEDTFAVLGYLAFLCSSIFAVMAAYFGLGTRDADLNEFVMVRCAEYLLYSQVTYGVSMPLVKASVVFTLVRITTEKKYLYSLYAMQFLSTLMAAIGILASLLYCHPVKAYWNPLLGKCGDFMVVVKIGYAWTAVGILTDLACAILPYLIVRKLQMSMRTKTTVMVILGLAAVACVATIVRAPYLQYYLVTTDRLYWNGYISIWCQLESGIGLIAASLPALRMLFRKYFDGIKSKQYGSSGTRGGIGGSHGDTPMDNLSRTGQTTVTGGRWKRLGTGDDDSTKNIIQETTVTVETESISDDEKRHREDCMV